MKTIAAEGTWCSNCEFFEVPDFDDGKCLACGCREIAHSDAQVVIEE